MKKPRPDRHANPRNARPARLRGMTLADMTALFHRAGQPAYRARQLFQWVYEKGARDFDEMTNLPKNLRVWLSENAAFGGLALRETAGEPKETQKLVFRADDGAFIESVLMREEEPDAEPDESEPLPSGSTAPRERVSLCVSSQVGCPLGCAFCMTGYGGFRRDLRVDEILDQALHARRMLQPGEGIARVVFMGMGEPLLNLQAVIPALQILTLPSAFALSARRVTVSTAGVLPGLRDLAEADLGVSLAVSLNAATQETRDRLMPACRRWPLAALLEECRRFPLGRRGRITFEYVMLKGINDRPSDARRLKTLLRDIPCKINLILYNPDERLGLQPTPEAGAEAFRATLAEAGFPAGVRRSKGRRHHAACGQLAAHFRMKNSNATSRETT